MKPNIDHKQIKTKITENDVISASPSTPKCKEKVRYKVHTILVYKCPISFKYHVSLLILPLKVALY